MNLDDIPNYDLLEIAWAAGILEGEGCFSNLKGIAIRIQVGSVDKDIIDRLISIFKVGFISERELISKKKFYIWIVSKNKDVKEVLHTILPFMGIRRTKKIEELLNK